MTLDFILNYLKKSCSVRHRSEICKTIMDAPSGVPEVSKDPERINIDVSLRYYSAQIEQTSKTHQ